MERKKGIHPVLQVFLALAALSFLASGAFAAERMAVKAGIANMRSGPGTKYEVLWQVEKYHPFIVKEKKGVWVKIEDFEGDKAWIHSSLLGKIKGVITTKSKCNVRAKSTTKSKVLFTVERGVPFKALTTKGDWIRIEHADGEKGWIHRSLVW